MKHLKKKTTGKMIRGKQLIVFFSTAVEPNGSVISLKVLAFLWTCISNLV